MNKIIAVVSFVFVLCLIYNNHNQDTTGFNNAEFKAVKMELKKLYPDLSGGCLDGTAFNLANIPEWGEQYRENFDYCIDTFIRLYRLNKQRT